MSDRIPEVGDTVSRQHGPFQSIWEVYEVKPNGVILSYVGPVVYVGFDHPISAPNGTQLTFSPREDWCGRAHYSSLQYTNAED